jgi:hypothetical protein
MVPLQQGGKPVNTNIPVYANVRPYSSHEEAHEKFTTLPTVEKGVVQEASWRYITKSKQYALVSVEFPRHIPHSVHNPHRWAFIEAKWLPATEEGLCKGFKPVAPDPKHSHWGPVCPK